MNVFSIKDPVFIFVRQKGKDTSRTMKFIVISLSLTVLVLADKQSHNFPNDDRYTDGYTYAASTRLPFSYTDIIFEPDSVDNSQPIIMLNDNQESTGAPQVEARTENIQRYFRVRRPIKRRKIFHIRRGNLNKDSEPISESLQLSDITPLITQNSQLEYPADSNSDDGLNYLPTKNDLSKDSIVYVSQPTIDINQKITPTNNVEPVSTLPDLIYDIGGRTRKRYHNRQKFRELEEIDDMKNIQPEKENDSSILDTSLQEINTASTLIMNHNLFNSNDNNSRNDFQETIITTGDLEITTSNPSTPIIEVIIETGTNELQKLPRFPYHDIIESPEEQEDGEKAVFLLDQIKVPQLIPEIVSRPEHNQNEFNNFPINDDKYHNEEINPSTIKIETIDGSSTIPLIELETVSSTKTIPRLRRKRIRGRRKFRKNTRLNNIHPPHPTSRAPQITSEEITTMKVLASSTELYAPQKDNFEENSTKKDELTQKMNTTEGPIPTTIRSSTMLINSLEVPKSRVRVQLPYRPKFGKHNGINNVPHHTDNMSDIEIATTSTSSQSGFEKDIFAKTTRLPYVNYRGRQKFRRLNERNLSEVITQNVPRLETVTTSTVQPSNTENVEKTVSIPETLHKNRDTSTYNIRKLNSRTFTRKQTRFNPTTVKSEITTSLPAVSESNIVSTDKPNHPQQESIRHRNRFRRIKKRTQSTTLRSTTASVGSEEEAILAEGNENTMSQNQPKRDFKIKSTPPPVPTLSPWYDGFGK